MTTLDLTKVSSLQFDNIDHRDYPDYSDANICYGEYDGEPLTEDQIDQLKDEHPDFVYEKLIDYIF
jgi:hypothetical protein